MPGRPKGSGQATPAQRKFAELVLGGMNQSEAYRQAYPNSVNYLPETVHKLASTLMRNPNVKRIVEEGRSLALQKITDRVAMDRAELIRRWEMQASTDRNEITQVRRIPCRYCWGRNGQYQERRPEREARWKAHQELLARTPEKEWPRIPPFDEMGGIGYTTKKEPNPECDNCDGDGILKPYIADSRTLSKNARELFEGFDVKQGQLVVNVKSREKAEENLAKALGVFTEKSINLNMNVDANAKVGDVPDDPAEAARAYQRIVGGE